MVQLLVDCRLVNTRHLHTARETLVLLKINVLFFSFLIARQTIDKVISSHKFEALNDCGLLRKLETLGRKSDLRKRRSFTF